MTDETKQLFDAPWYVTTNMDIFEICKHGRVFPFAETLNEQDVNRLARLPELYDALMDAVVQFCPDAFLANDECRLCPKEQCKGREWVELLRKVRDGEDVSETNQN